MHQVTGRRWTEIITAFIPKKEKKKKTENLIWMLPSFSLPMKIWNWLHKAHVASSGQSCKYYLATHVVYKASRHSPNLKRLRQRTFDLSGGTTSWLTRTSNNRDCFCFPIIKTKKKKKKHEIFSHGLFKYPLFEQRERGRELKALVVVIVIILRFLSVETQWEARENKARFFFVLSSVWSWDDFEVSSCTNSFIIQF